MVYDYERITFEEGLPIKAFIHSIANYKLHWHQGLEIIFVLKGSISIQLEQSAFVLHQNDLILLNANEVHSTLATQEENILLALQIDPEFPDAYFPDLPRVRFDWKSAMDNEPLKCRLRQWMARIIWEFSKKSKGYPFAVISALNALISELLRLCPNEVIDVEHQTQQASNLQRIKRIMDYINEHYAEKITLQQIAQHEFVNFYYLSHFFKDQAGVTFQDYINAVRLEKALPLVRNTSRSLTDIAADCGFSSRKLFARFFREKYQASPDEYRKILRRKELRCEPQPEGVTENRDVQPGQADARSAYLQFSQTDAMQTILAWLNDDAASSALTVGPAAGASETLDCAADLPGQPLNRHWRRLTAFSRAAEALRADVSTQLQRMQNEIPFEYVRFHGIFNDEMMVCRQQDDGAIAYNWIYVDQILDLFRENGLKPMIELSFMPSELASGQAKVFWWGGNITPPRDIRQWTALVGALVSHCLNRYGLDEVAAWYFEVWNEPDFANVCWTGSQMDYFQFYEATARTIHGLSGQLRVGGPSLTPGSVRKTDWLDRFLDYCRNNQVPLDFVTYHIYSELHWPDDPFQRYGEFRYRAVGDRWLSGRMIRQVREQINRHPIRTGDGQPLPAFVTEWNVTARPLHLIRDTAFMAPFILQTAVDCLDCSEMLGFWTFTDLMEEHRAGPTAFHGGFGLMTMHGLPKPTWFAFRFLNQLGDSVIRKGDHFIITRQGNRYQILFWHLGWFDHLASSGDWSGLTETERYTVYEENPIRVSHLHMTGLVPGQYQITRQRLDRQNGSVFDAWLELGAPPNLSPQAVDWLQHRAIPGLSIENVQITDDFQTEISLPPHACELILIEPVY